MKRRWFQIHLSTAVVLMICAGGLLGLNVEKRPNPDAFLKAMGVEFDDLDIEYLRGWPFVFEEKSFPDWGAGAQMYFGRLIGNVAVGLAILFCIAAVCEVFVRRRKARSPAAHIAAGTESPRH